MLGQDRLHLVPFRWSFYPTCLSETLQIRALPQRYVLIICPMSQRLFRHLPHRQRIMTPYPIHMLIVLPLTMRTSPMCCRPCNAIKHAPRAWRSCSSKITIYVRQHSAANPGSMYTFVTFYGCANNLGKLREKSRVKSMRCCHASSGGSVSTFQAFVSTACRYAGAIHASVRELHE